MSRGHHQKAKGVRLLNRVLDKIPKELSTPLGYRRLAEEAWERSKAGDSNLEGKATAWTTANVMRVKRKVAAGCCGFKSGIRKIRKHIGNGNNLTKNIADALLIARRVFSKQGKKAPRIIPVPKTGGILPLIPIFAALGALGSIASGAASVVKVVKDANAARDKLQEEKRHNLAIENGKQIGNGLYLRPYKKGYGLYLKPWRGEGLKKKPLNF